MLLSTGPVVVATASVVSAVPAVAGATAFICIVVDAGPSSTFSTVTCGSSTASGRPGLKPIGASVFLGGAAPGIKPPVLILPGILKLKSPEDFVFVLVSEDC